MLLDLVGGPYVKNSQKLMAHKGHMMLVGTVAGGAYELDARYVMSKRLQIRGTVLRARSLEEKIAAARLFAAQRLFRCSPAEFSAPTSIASSPCPKSSRPTSTSNRMSRLGRSWS